MWYTAHFEDEDSTTYTANEVEDRNDLQDEDTNYGGARLHHRDGSQHGRFWRFRFTARFNNKDSYTNVVNAADEGEELQEEETRHGGSRVQHDGVTHHRRGIRFGQLNSSTGNEVDEGNDLREEGTKHGGIGHIADDGEDLHEGETRHGGDRVLRAGVMHHQRIGFGGSNIDMSKETDEGNERHRDDIPHGETAFTQDEDNNEETGHGRVRSQQDGDTHHGGGRSWCTMRFEDDGLSTDTEQGDNIYITEPDDGNDRQGSETRNGRTGNPHGLPANAERTEVEDTEAWKHIDGDGETEGVIATANPAEIGTIDEDSNEIPDGDMDADTIFTDALAQLTITAPDNGNDRHCSETRHEKTGVPHGLSENDEHTEVEGTEAGEHIDGDGETDGVIATANPMEIGNIDEDSNEIPDSDSDEDTIHTDALSHLTDDGVEVHELGAPDATEVEGNLFPNTAAEGNTMAHTQAESIMEHQDTRDHDTSSQHSDAIQQDNIRCRERSSIVDDNARRSPVYIPPHARTKDHDIRSQLPWEIGQTTGRCKRRGVTNDETRRNPGYVLTYARMTNLGDATPETRKHLKISSFNMQSARGFRLVTMLRELERMKMDLALLTETRLTDDIYTRSAYGFQVSATCATTPHKGGVAFAWRDNSCWQLEGVHHHRPNVISAVIVSGRKKVLTVGVYLPPSEQSEDSKVTLQQVIEACQRFPRLPQILLGDFKFDLKRTPQSAWETAVHATIAEAAVKDLSESFQPQRKF